MSHLNFHASFYARLPNLTPASSVTLRGVEVSPLVTDAGVAPTFVDFFDVTFETTLERLQALPGVDAEPDGFFVYGGPTEHGRWRLSGHLYDFGDRMHRMELNGDCPPSAVDDLWRCLGWPDKEIACELVLEGVVLAEDDFRRWAGK
ncbi:MAG: hypothetical protein KDA61_10335 [Planctomycetales bacterium]|nr:hypothetical protein [Planctomycetales bacterium]